MSKKKKTKLLQKADRVAQGLLEKIPNLRPLSHREPAEASTTHIVLQGKPFECFLCGGRVVIKLSKKNRPYFHCLACYLQCFVRGDAGIRRLAKRFEGDKE